MKNSFCSIVCSFPFDPPPNRLSVALLRIFLSSLTDCSNTGRRDLNSLSDNPVNACNKQGQGYLSLFKTTYTDSML